MGRRRMREMEQTVASIQERWGPRAIRRATQAPALSEAATLSTGYPALDRLLGQGGLARGHITELVGGGTAGQMTLAAKVLTQAQAAGQQVVYVDAFQMIDLDFLARCGVHLEPLVVLRPLHWRHAMQMTGDLIRGGGAGAIVLDRLHPTLAGSAELTLEDEAHLVLLAENRVGYGQLCWLISRASWAGKRGLRGCRSTAWRAIPRD